MQSTWLSSGICEKLKRIHAFLFSIIWRFHITGESKKKLIEQWITKLFKLGGQNLGDYVFSSFVLPNAHITTLTRKSLSPFKHKFLTISHSSQGCFKASFWKHSFWQVVRHIVFFFALLLLRSEKSLLNSMQVFIINNLSFIKVTLAWQKSANPTERRASLYADFEVSLNPLLHFGNVPLR